jgi:hypothetical protein
MISCRTPATTSKTLSTPASRLSMVTITFTSQIFQKAIQKDIRKASAASHTSVVWG